MAETDAETDESPKLDPFSPLYARYNGSMLGFFLAGSFGQFAAPRYPALRQRMHEFLRELDITLGLPEAHADFVAGHEGISMDVLRAVSEKSSAVLEFALLSSLAMYYVIARAGKQPDAGQMRDEALRLMGEHGIDPRLLKDFAAGVRARKDGSIDADRLNSSSLVFLHELISPLPAEPDTAFVAMPFAEGMRENFPILYVPVLRQSGYRALRAWGGLGSEEYQDLVTTLISKCGVVLADLTTLNQNVLHEVGFAHGRDDILLLLIAEKDKVVPPSNLSNLAIFQYEKKGENWQEEAIPLLAMMITLGKLGLQIAEEKKQRRAAGRKSRPAKPKPERQKPRAGRK